MSPTFIKRLRRSLGNESGAGLIDTMVGAVVSALLIGVVAAGIAMMLTYPAQQAGITKATGEIAAADSQFREDVRTAGTTAMNAGALELTRPDATCGVSWAAKESEGTLKLVRTECPGGSDPVEQIISADAGTVNLSVAGGVATLRTRFGGYDRQISFAERTGSEPGAVKGGSTYDGVKNLRE